MCVLKQPRVVNAETGEVLQEGNVNIAPEAPEALPEAATPADQSKKIKRNRANQVKSTILTSTRGVDTSTTGGQVKTLLGS